MLDDTNVKRLTTANDQNICPTIFNFNLDAKFLSNSKL